MTWKKNLQEFGHIGEKHYLRAKFQIMQDNHSFIHRIPAMGWTLSLVLSALMLMGCDNLNSKKTASENVETEQVAENTADEVGDNGVKAPEIQADAAGDRKSVV